MENRKATNVVADHDCGGDGDDGMSELIVKYADEIMGHIQAAYMAGANRMAMAHAATLVGLTGMLSVFCPAGENDAVAEAVASEVDDIVVAAFDMLLGRVSLLERIKKGGRRDWTA